MLLVDVNVFVYAARRDSVRHEEYRDWLNDRMTGPEGFGVDGLVLSGFVRVVSNHRVFAQPTPTSTALDFCRRVLDAPAAVQVNPGPRHWGLFDGLCRAVAARANVVPDAYLAALAMENDATWVTTDRGFARFPGLRTRHPLDPDPVPKHP